MSCPTKNIEEKDLQFVHPDGTGSAGHDNIASGTIETTRPRAPNMRVEKTGKDDTKSDTGQFFALTTERLQRSAHRSVKELAVDNAAMQSFYDVRWRLARRTGTIDSPDLHCRSLMLVHLETSSSRAV